MMNIQIEHLINYYKQHIAKLEAEEKCSIDYYREEVQEYHKDLQKYSIDKNKYESKLMSRLFRRKYKPLPAPYPFYSFRSSTEKLIDCRTGLAQLTYYLKSGNKTIDSGDLNLDLSGFYNFCYENNIPY